MEAVEARIEAKGGSKWGNFAAAEAKLSSSLIEPDSKTWWLKPEWKKGEVAGIAETVFLASSPYYPLSSSWPFSRSFLLRLASWMELGRQVGSTTDLLLTAAFPTLWNLKEDCWKAQQPDAYSHYMTKLIFVTPSRYRMLDWRQNVGDFNFLICLAPEIPEILGIWGESITAMYFSHFGRSLYWIGVTLDKTQKFFNAWIRTSDGRVEIALPLTISLKQKWLSHTNKPFYMK